MTNIASAEHIAFVFKVKQYSRKEKHINKDSVITSIFLTHMDLLGILCSAMYVPISGPKPLRRFGKVASFFSSSFVVQMMRNVIFPFICTEDKGRGMLCKVYFPASTGNISE